MSTSPSSRPGSSVDKRHAKKRDRPPALELTTPMAEPSLEDQVLNALNPRPQGHELRDKDGPRSASAASSSLDPYYYTSRTPAESPIPPLPAGPETLPRTPDLPASYPPITPSRDPAAIDRRGLVGVGDLTTPRWARYKETRKFNTEEVAIPEAEDVQMGIADDGIERDADSPWTIEAVDEPKDEFIEEDNEHSMPSRETRQDASESGGEEIVYPRQPTRANVQHQPAETKSTSPPVSSVDSPVHMSPNTRAMFGTPTTAKQRRPRTSDATSDLDGGFSTHYSDSATPKDKGRDDLSASARKHRSLGLGMGLSTPKDRPQRDGTLQNSGNTVTRSSSTKHSRTTSSGSQAKRGHDFSHLPPSPSATTMHHNTKHTLALSTSSPLHNTSAVAHSLLRGTQEGWSSLNDEATAEALRKLDGVSAKSPQSRTRTSIGSRPTSMSRPSSRPGTPGGVRGAQWEGITAFDGGRTSRSSKKATSSGDEKRASTSSKMALNLGVEDPSSTDGGESNPHPPSAEKPKKRSSILASKRASGSSTVYTSTPTVSSRDSGSISVGTSLTSASANSHRLSLKARRNSAGSDNSAHSSEVASLKDRAAALISSNDVFEPEHVPPVPPLPKDLSSFRSPPHSSTSMHFSPIPMPPRQEELDPDSTLSFDTAPTVASDTSPIVASPISPPASQPTEAAASPAARPPPKSPGRKWSFNPLNIGLKSPTSPTSKASSMQASRSPVSSSVPTHMMGPPLANKRSMDAWSQPGAMASAASLASLSSIGSLRNSPAASMAPSLTIASSPDQAHDLADSDARVSPPTQGGLAPAQAPLSPSSSVRRGNSTRRLTPSSIPFFRRSSSQIAQPPNLNEQPSSSSPPVMSPVKKAPVRLRVKSTISTADTSLSSPATPSSTQKKSSVLSFLRGSTSRKNLQSESERMDMKSDRETRRLTKDADKMSKEEKKKDDKDRSESRISVLMGRKRGKTVSSTDPKKAKPPVVLPPIQVGALPQVTAQRVASLNSSTSTPVSSVSSRGGASVSSRVTAPTISSLHKQSDTSLRSTRGQLPTIAGSPSVATTGEGAHSGFKEPSMPPLSSLNVSTSLPKETPTKIPRKSGQPSAIPSPVLKGSVSSVSTVTARRASLHVSSSSGTPSIAGISPSPSVATPKDNLIDEFGVMSDTPVVKAVGATPTQRMSVRASPSIASTSSRVPRQVSAPVAASTRKNRESMSFAGLRKASTSSVTSMSSAAPSEAPVPNTNRFSALSPSKGLKLLSPKISLSSNRHSVHSSIANVSTSAASSRQSLSTPSPVPSSVDEEELLGDEEMLACIKRQHTKKLANGAKQEDLDEMLKFPEPLPPATGHSPADVLRSSQVKYLSEYERKEILDFEKVYFFGARSQKKLATLDNSTNNHGYDDDRGDYLIVNHDHLAYRYEVVGSLGKGSFGQVLKCRDHRTGEFVAIKIIRNKKRFHHQALVEIKILENLREWDPEDKHQVIQMIEHFNFRGHLCIAMELLSMNLYELIKANSFVGFSTSLIRRFTNQMLLSLSLMRHHRIVHCDLKPENILLKHPAKSAIKVIDFGSSCLEHEKIYTYIQSRFYRSPEVILGMNYHMAIDMWSLGCIMAELYTGFPIFPGENEQEQLSCIMEVLGLPEKDFINRSSRKKLFFDPSGAPRPVVNSKGRRRRPGTKSLAQVLRCDDELFVDFIAKCLTWDPEKRMKPQQALRHPFILPQRRPKILNSMSGTKSFLSSAASLSSSSRSKPTETPKKSQIGAPAPLSSRMSRTTSGTVATTPLTSSSTHTLGSSSRSYRTSQSQTFSTYQPSRTISSFATTK